MKRRKSGRWRKAKGDAGEREVLDLLTKAGWIVKNGAMAESGIDLVAVIPIPGRLAFPNAGPLQRFYAFYAESKNEPWAARGRAYLAPICATAKAHGILYRVFSHEAGGWFVREIEPHPTRHGVRTVYKAPATVPNLTVGGLLTGSHRTPATKPERGDEE